MAVLHPLDRPRFAEQPTTSRKGVEERLATRSRKSVQMRTEIKENGAGEETETTNLHDKGRETRRIYVRGQKRKEKRKEGTKENEREIRSRKQQIRDSEWVKQ